MTDEQLMQFLLTATPEQANALLQRMCNGVLHFGPFTQLN
jgi:hypothetical protein